MNKEYTYSLLGAQGFTPSNMPFYINLPVYTDKIYINGYLYKVVFGKLILISEGEE